LIFLQQQLCLLSGPVVQWIERQIPVLKVGGSSPFGITKKEKAALAVAFFFLIPERLRTTKGVRTKRSDLMSGLVCLPVGSE
jgi:hypothetical protein